MTSAKCRPFLSRPQCDNTSCQVGWSPCWPVLPSTRRRLCVLSSRASTTRPSRSSRTTISTSVVSTGTLYFPGRSRQRRGEKQGRPGRTNSRKRQHSLSHRHYNDVIMTTMASQITSLAVIYSTVYSDADQRKHQSSASLAFVWGIHRDRPVTRKMLPFDDIIMITEKKVVNLTTLSSLVAP